MGKTANGAIWLNDDKLRRQFWRNTEDKDIIRFLKYLLIPISQIQEIQKLKVNCYKILLANEVTKQSRNRSKELMLITQQRNFRKKLV